MPRKFKPLLRQIDADLSRQVMAGDISPATYGTYHNNISRILEAFVKTHTEQEALLLVRQTASSSKTNAETQRVYRILREKASKMDRN